MAKGAKKRRIGSDDYTLDLERRIGDLEKFMATFKQMEKDLKEKDSRIEMLEKEIALLKNVPVTSNEDQNLSGMTPVPTSSASGVEDKPKEKFDFLIIGDFDR